MRSADHDLDGGTTFAANIGDQTLRDHTTQIQGQIHEQLFVQIMRKHVNDTFHRLVGVVGVQGGDREMPSVGKLHRRLHGHPVTNLTNEYDVRRFTQ